MRKKSRIQLASRLLWEDRQFLQLRNRVPDVKRYYHSQKIFTVIEELASSKTFSYRKLIVRKVKHVNQIILVPTCEIKNETKKKLKTKTPN